MKRIEREIPQSLLDRFIYKDGQLYYRNFRRSGVERIVKSVNVHHKNKAYMTTSIVLAMHGILLKEGEAIISIDKNRLNFNINNLKVASYSEVGFTNKLSKSNKTGFKNVFYAKQIKKFVAAVWSGSKQYRADVDTLHEAINKANELRLAVAGEFAYDGINKSGLIQAVPSFADCKLLEDKIKAAAELPKVPQPTTAAKVDKDATTKVKTGKEAARLDLTAATQLEDLGVRFEILETNYMNRIEKLEKVVEMLTTKLKDLL